MAEQLIRKLEQLMAGSDLDSTAKVCSDLNERSFLDHLTADHWVDMSALLHDKLWQPGAAYELNRRIIGQPKLYGAISRMAIEAAIRERSSGLQSLFLVLIKLGRPQQIVDSYTRYREDLARYQGKDQRDLSSWDRETRLAARVTSTSVRPLTILNLAALSMLNQLDGQTLVTLLGSTQSFDSIPLDPTFIAARRCLRQLPDGEIAVDKYLKALERFKLAILCHHPSIFVASLKALASSGSATKHNESYDTIMAASTGKDKFLMLWDLDSKMRFDSTKGIPIPLKVWCQ
jgi:hypothetical protein